MQRTPRQDPAATRAAPGDPDARRLAAVLHATFLVLLATAMARYLQRHGGEPRAPWVIALAAVLAVLYVLGRFGDRPGARDTDPGWPAPPRLLWLGSVVAVWGVLVALAPSFAWVAVPLFYAALRHLPPTVAYVLVTVLTAFVIGAQLQLAPRFDLDLVVGPAAVAGFATAIFVHLRHQAARQRALIDDLVRTRRELAATERRAGTLAERQRLAMEIHDTLAQGLSSQQMLLQAAERVWASDPDKARAHVRTAETVAEHNLTEARRFVHDLAPADLAGGGGLGEALRRLAARESGDTLTVRVHVDAGGRAPELLPDRVQSALLRIAQGALANVREHSGATAAALTLTLLDDQAVLDVADDGRGFDPGARSGDPSADPSGVRGHGLPAIRARVRQLGGTLTVESAPGEGTVLSAAIPLEPTP
ncbi:sensor histidine kinase [Streptomyces sp. NPDC048002]|uniref:sensor histidine kinase n=1 Tax=Streptomyces sp. NPDC048002 TaxID=3154344 RepID=UPI0033CE702F